MRPFILITVLLFIACSEESTEPTKEPVNYRQEMRRFVQEISRYAEERHAGFFIIPQNGLELLTANGEPDGAIVADYLAAIDGVGQEDLFYGYVADNEPTPLSERAYLTAFCDIAKRNGVPVLTTDYCRSHPKMDDSYSQNHAKGYLSFAAPERELTVIPEYPPQPFNVNAGDIAALIAAKNFLYLINLENFADKQSFIKAVSGTDYDLIITDCFWGDQAFTTAEVMQMKTKHNGGRRIVVSYLSIGEAEEYRYYWQPGWTTKPPSWLGAENPQWAGNYAVRYWEQEWQKIIFGTDSSYLEQLLAAGFDGAYLDKVDAFEQETN
ncbi:MAG: hypothetical protein EHM72_16300 [Calditrichaeota bacterium]|nr:MAG: hypothetical protein EHM72_16300 [Calditrichota bacterium]